MVKVVIRDPKDKQTCDKKYVVGIDFGTTNSLIAVSNDSIPRIIKSNNGDELIKSIISFNGKNYVVGEERESHIKSIKRLFGQDLSEILAKPVIYNQVKEYLDLASSKPKLKFCGSSVDITEIASEIFRYLKVQAETDLIHKVTQCVISVPAHFNNRARGEVILAAKLAGFEVLRLIAEPTAAAYAYGLNKFSNGCYLVYDFGGGTFDVSILLMQEGIFQVIATSGDNFLGGDDIDFILAEYIAEKYHLKLSSKLQELAKSIKQEFFIGDIVNRNFDDQIIQITLNEFETLIFPLIEKTINITLKTHQEVEEIKLDGIILAGGSTRIKLVEKLLAKTFKTKLFSSINPDKVVAFGTALQAENLSGYAKKNLLIDVVPLSLSLELHGGISEKIVLRNTPIPFSVTKEFTNYADYQTKMSLHILQGEREMVSDLQSLGRFEITLPLMKAGGVRMQVTFSIDADGILSVQAFEKNSGNSANLEIRPFCINQDYIDDSLASAYENAKLDHNARILLEAKLYTKSLILNVKNALKEMEKLISSQELEEFEDDIVFLNSLLENEDKEKIVEYTKAFDEKAKELFSRRLNSAIFDILKGKKI